MLSTRDPPQNKRHIQTKSEGRFLLVILILCTVVYMRQAGDMIQREASRAVVCRGTEYISPHLMDPSMKHWIYKEFIYREQKGSVILRNVETNTSTVLIEGKKIESLRAIRYEISPDREYALFSYNVEPVSTLLSYL
ncbi:hypothetical protein FD755_012108 [Muntiacus reevesi]|uniref:Dipeptidylpeptidase IV N-terminal domain-containing protein n=1 Tax=Muntiacus reevesi TaxID=9886 RepID=A0A5N3XN37_MUNRE|nr:hypothetical protein FD755_012108 [Muntiacus reevesi]